jgi:hypothetical protein
VRSYRARYRVPGGWGKPTLRRDRTEVLREIILVLQHYLYPRYRHAYTRVEAHGSTTTWRRDPVKAYIVCIVQAPAANPDE